MHNCKIRILVYRYKRCSHHDSVKILRKMTGNNPKLDLVNDDVHIKFVRILSIHSQDLERKQNSDVNQEP